MNWINVKDRLPEPELRVIRYNSNVNISQENMAVSVCDGQMLKYADEGTWWMPIPELPEPLKVH